jgi:hypothetical protein
MRDTELQIRVFGKRESRFQCHKELEVSKKKLLGKQEVNIYNKIETKLNEMKRNETKRN